MDRILPSVRGKYRVNVDLSKLCWFGIGGKASILFIPFDEDDLVHFLSSIQQIPIFVFGVGSNTLIRDGGFDGVVIRLGRSMNYMRLIGDNLINVGASVLDQNVSQFALEHNIGGLEFMSGIPGTVGGGLAMNGGAYGREFSDVVVSVDALDLRGNKFSLTNSQMGFKYRKNSLAEQMIFINAALKGYSATKEEIRRKVEDIKHLRTSTQPVKNVKTGGSTFKNPPGLKAWQLIDQAGCRGLKVGGAKISELHCNFLLNTGDATVVDIENLIKIVKKRVFDKSGVQLEEELVFIGESL